MKSSMSNLEKKQITDYDLDSKIQVFANIGIVYARLLESKSQYDEVARICESLLLTPLHPHTRKIINSIKARVSGVTKSTTKVGDKKQQAAAQQAGESVIFDVVSQIEIIQNTTNKAQVQELIKKCFETLQNLPVKENDETDLELHAELWARLARLALNEENLLMYKYSLRCVENSLKYLSPNADYSNIPQSRMRWYSLAEYLYSESLVRMLNPDTQETKSQEKLLFHALKHAVEAANKGSKANINILVLDASKQIWNICAKLQDSVANRKLLIKPIYQTIFYLKSIKEKSEPDLTLLLSQLLFKAAIENEDYAQGEQAADMVFELIPKNLQKPIWESKMIFMSKQGKNELQAISNMKEADSSLQAKVWIKLARASTNALKQYNAFQKAIEILKKDSSVEIVEIYIEYSEWMLRNNYTLNYIQEVLLAAADNLIDIEHDEEDDDEDDENKPATIFSRSSRGKKSTISKGSKAKSKLSATKSKLSKQQQGKNRHGSELKSSKASQKTYSRMSRASIRVTKTIKSKQSKSIFTQREEEANPEQLNCLHYERLMRIHTMLAQIARNQEQQIQYCLDAKFFLIKIFEISFKTLNQQEYNIAVYQNINDEKQLQGQKLSKDFTSQVEQQQPGQKDFVPKYKLPTKIDEWISLQFSKEFLEKVKQSEDFNFMGKFVFEKAELTFYYVGQLIEMFQLSGLHSHAIPLYIFQRFIAHEILIDHYLSELTEFKFARCLAQLQFHSQSQQILSSHNLLKFNISAQELKESIARVESSRIQHIAQNDVVQLHEVDQQAAPFIISTPHTYIYWGQIARELLLAGEVTRAFELLEQVNHQAKIVKDVECVGEVTLLQSWIAQIQGDFKQSAILIQSSHKWIKKVELWEQNSLITFHTLYKLKKTNDIKIFLDKLINMFTTLSGQQQHSYNIISIKFALSTFYILRAKLYFKQLQKDFAYSKFRKGCTAIEQFITNLQQQGANKDQFELILKSIFKLALYLEQQNYTDFSIVQKSFRIFDKLIKFLEIFEEKVKSLLKYTMLLEKQTQMIQGPLNITYNQIKLLISKLETNKGILNLIQRSVEYTEWKEIAMPSSQIKEQQDEKDEKDDDFEEKLDKVNELKSSNYEPLNKYLALLTQQIEMALLPIPKKLVSFERAIAILISLIPKIDKNNQQQFIMAKLEFARANRYLALQQDEMKELWLRQGEVLSNESQILKPKEDDQQELGFNVDYQLQSFQCIQDILENDEFKQLVDNVLITPHAFYNSALFAEEVMENFGNKYPDTSIEYLFKYQHFKNIEMFKSILKRSAPSDYKPHLLLKMNKFIFTNYLTIQNQEIENQLKNFKVWSQVYQIPDYKEVMREVLPMNSAYLTISLSPNKQSMYVGFMIITKKRETPIELFNRQLNKGDWDLLTKLISGMNKIKQILIKTPIITDDEYKKLEEEQNLAYQVLFSEFQQFCKFFTPALDKIINSPLEEVEQNVEEQQQQIGGKKPVPAAAKKKGQKDELPVYDSPLKSTLSGIDNLVIFLDYELMSLPFEFLYPFNEIPAKSRDFSLFLLAKRYKNIQFNSQLNNSTGIQRDKLKYVIYDFKQSEENYQTEANIASCIELGMKPGGNFSNLKFQGNTTSQRIASIGEWQKYLSSASGLLFYGHPSILEILSPKLFTDLLEINETKAFLVFDRINAIKTMIEKQNSLDQNSDKIPVIEQPLMTLVLLSLLGASTIAINQWSINPIETANTLKSLLTSLNQQIYFASTLNSYKLPQVVYLDKDGNQIDILSKDDKQKKPPSQNKKGPKQTPQQIEQQQPQQEQLDLKKQEQFRKLLYLHHVIFMGVPIIRLS